MTDISPNSGPVPWGRLYAGRNPPSRTRRFRVGAILQALLDKEGADALSMRRVADKLGGRKEFDRIHTVRHS